MTPKGKPGLLIAIGGPKPPPGGDEPDDLTMAAQELIRAVKSGDASAVADALRAAHGACASEYGDK